MSEQLAGDTPTHRLTIAELSDDEIDNMLQGIRVRRLQAWNKYQEAQELKKKAQNERQYDKLIKQCNKMEKLFSDIDARFEKLEKLALEIRALRLEIEG